MRHNTEKKENSKLAQWRLSAVTRSMHRWSCQLIFSPMRTPDYSECDVMSYSVSVWWIVWLNGWLQYNTIQLYCLCVEKFAFWFVIYIKTFKKINNKTSTTQWNTELKTAQIQGKYLTITMYTHAHARTYARTLPPPTHTHTILLAHQ